jgi:hypothetical protein
MIFNKHLLVVIALFLACTTAAIAAEPTVYYLHGRIIEEKGVQPVHPKFGLYDYPAVVVALGTRGANVISEARASGTVVDEYAKKTVADIEGLIAGGVAADQIIVVGFSKGGAIAIYISSLLDNPDVRFVFMASCGRWISSQPELRPTGHVLSVIEESDGIAGSCDELAFRNKDLGSFQEIKISTGKQHGAFYVPRAEWLEPVLDYIHGDGKTPG